LPNSVVLSHLKKDSGKMFKRKRIIVFSPYSGIWAHQLQQTQLFRKYNFTEFDIITVSCGALLNRHCAVFESFGNGFDQKKQDQICKKCRISSGMTSTALNVFDVQLSDYLSSQERGDQLNISKKISSEKLVDFKVNGYEIGRLSAFETLIKYKKTDFLLDPEQEQYWRNGIYQGLVTLLSGERIIEKYQPDLVLAYSPQYAAGSVFAEVCRVKSIPVYFLEGSIHLSERYKAMHIWSWDHYGLVDPAIGKFKVEPDFLMSKSKRRRVTKHLMITEKSKSFAAYSTGKKKKQNIRSEFKIPIEKKIVLCALSSTDEIFSGYVIGKIASTLYEGNVFQNQFDWICETIELAKIHQEIFFIIRLHPRMASNRRENITSPDVEKWRELLSVLPKNVIVDYPEDKRSVSNYFDQIDLLVTGWSSTAIDAMSKGVPALSYDAAVSWFPQVVVFACTSKQEYRSTLLRKLDEGRSERNRQLAFDWLNYRLINGTVEVQGRVIDRLHLSNFKIVEKIYSFVTKYMFKSLARFELFMLPRKKHPLPLEVGNLLSGKNSSLH
jgi:hypothetical protein